MKALNEIKLPQTASGFYRIAEEQNQSKLNQNFRAIVDAINELEQNGIPSSGEATTGLPAATTSKLGGIIVGQNLSVSKAGVLSVTTAAEIAEDNTKPITSAAVYTTVGNINALLETI